MAEPPTNVALSPQVNLLMGLFPSHPLAHNRIKCIDAGGSKRAPVIPRAASCEDYARHIATKSYGGVGALGIYPGMLIREAEQANGSWHVPFFALDFDQTPPFDLVALIDTLEGHDLYTYPSCGTTGRGSHLYGFLAKPLPQPVVQKAVSHIAAIAVDVGLPRPELRPSATYGRGCAIFIPYRGVERNGYGYNPLLDPFYDLNPIALRCVGEYVLRVSVDALHHFVEGLPHETEKVNYFCGDNGSVRGPFSRNTLHGVAALEAELKRILPHYVKASRQNLIMGIAAYTARALELGFDEARSPIETFLVDMKDEEVDRRMSAVKRTFEKYLNRALVAWHEYYRQAGIEPPSGSVVNPKVKEKLAHASYILKTHHWTGRGGMSDRSAYAALLATALKHGALHDRGVTVSISIRCLALEAGVGDKTVKNALARLDKADLVTRYSNLKRACHESGSFILLLEGVSNLSHSLLDEGGLNEWGYLNTHPAFRHGKLNKSAAPLVIALLQNGAGMTKSALAKAVDKKAREIRGPLRKLLEHKILAEVKSHLVLTHEWQEALEQAAHATGAYRTVERQQENHSRERRQFSETLQRSRKRAARDEKAKAKAYLDAA